MDVDLRSTKLNPELSPVSDYLFKMDGWIGCFSRYFLGRAGRLAAEHMALRRCDEQKVVLKFRAICYIRGMELLRYLMTLIHKYHTNSISYLAE
jgi:hypothetical protein